MRNRLLLALAALIVGFLVIVVAGRRPSPTAAAEVRHQRGLQLAQRHCTQCHLLPEPDQLPRESWPDVLGWMGQYLGVGDPRARLASLADTAMVPSEPLLSAEEFAAVRAYFLDNAPAGPLRQPRKPRIRHGISWLTADSTPLEDIPDEMVTLVEIDEERHRLFVGHGMTSSLLVFDSRGKRLARADFDTPPVAVAPHAKGAFVTLIGDLWRDRNNGQVVDLRFGETAQSSTTLVAGLPRLSHATFADLTGDGLPDIVLSGFGDFQRGRFSWAENLGDGRYREHVLLNHSGALKSAVHDFNDDGLSDIVTVVAQGRQEVLLFLNRGGGKFERVGLVRKFPGFGFHSIDVADFDADGRMDLLLVNGNNMEIPEAPLRDYHGVRIYRNEGELRFREAYFYPMYGAIAARIGDFSGDGRLDIAAVAMFPDWSADRPEGFVLLEGKRGLEFTPRSHPATHGGRWMTLDAGDLDGDGRPELVLGGTTAPLGLPPERRDEMSQRFSAAPRVLLLRNESRATGK